MTEPTVERIPQHRHCEKCGKAFVGKGNFCSPECEETARGEVKGKLRKLMSVQRTEAVAFRVGVRGASYE